MAPSLLRFFFFFFLSDMCADPKKMPVLYRRKNERLTNSRAKLLICSKCALMLMSRSAFLAMAFKSFLYILEFGYTTGEIVQLNIVLFCFPQIRVLARKNEELYAVSQQVQKDSTALAGKSTRGSFLPIFRTPFS